MQRMFAEETCGVNGEGEKNFAFHSVAVSVVAIIFEFILPFH